jgi:hypothetical protein
MPTIRTDQVTGGVVALPIHQIGVEVGCLVGCGIGCVVENTTFNKKKKKGLEV